MYKLYFTYENYRERTPILKDIELEQAIQILNKFKDNPQGELENEIDSILSDFETDELLNYQAWANQKNHYATRRIIKQVSNNDWNQDMTIRYESANQYPIDYREPDQPHTFTKELNSLFKRGADIILETNQGFDDEGRDCYQAYIIRPEHKKSFQEYWDDNMERNGKMLYQLAIMEYITKYPEHIITIWAGPY